MTLPKNSSQVSCGGNERRVLPITRSICGGGGRGVFRRFDEASSRRYRVPSLWYSLFAKDHYLRLGQFFAGQLQVNITSSLFTFIEESFLKC